MSLVNPDPSPKSKSALACSDSSPLGRLLPSTLGATTIADAQPLSEHDLAAQNLARSVIMATTQMLGTIPRDQDLSTSVNQLGERIRDAARNDPLLKALGVQLGDKFEVVLIDSDAPNAYILPFEPDRCYIHTGLIRILQNGERVAGVLAHEHAHPLHETITELRRFKATSRRFGEQIWRDPLALAITAPAFDLLAAKILSKPNESWCDTAGSFYYLDAAGIDPLKQAEAISATSTTTETYDDLDERYEDQPTKQSIAILRKLLATHPPDQERLTTALALAHHASYPSSLSPQPTPNLPERTHAEVQNKASTNSQRTLKTTPLSELIAHQVFLNKKRLDSDLEQYQSNFSALPLFTKDQLSLKELPVELSTLSRDEQISILGSMALFFGILSKGVTDENSIKASPEQDWSQQTEPSREDLLTFRACVKTATTGDGIATFSSDADLDISIIENFSRHALLQFVDKLHQLGMNGMGYLLEVEGIDKPTLSPKDLSELPTMIEIALSGVRPFLEAFWYLQKNSPARFIYGLESSTEQARVRDYQFRNPKLVAHPVPESPSSRRALENRVLQHATGVLSGLTHRISEAVVKFAGNNTFKNDDSFLSWLTELKKNVSASPCVAGFIPPEHLAELALRYAAHIPKSRQAALIEKLADQNLLPNPHYLSHKLGARVIQSSQFIGLFGPLRVGFKAFSAKALKILAVRAPLLHDLCVIHELQSSGTIADSVWSSPTPDVLKKLRSLREPVLLSPFFTEGTGSSGAVVNIHDKWAYADSPFRAELIRAATNIEDYLKRLCTIPHLFSEDLWGKLVPHIITELSDVLALVRFIDQEMSDSSGQLAWLGKNRARSMIIVATEGIKLLQSHAKLDLTDDTIRSQIIDLITLLPRTSLRNEIVSTVAEQTSELEFTGKLDFLYELSKRIETEPHQQMIEDLIAELRESSSPELNELERFLANDIPYSLDPSFLELTDKEIASRMMEDRLAIKKNESDKKNRGAITIVGIPEGRFPWLNLTGQALDGSGQYTGLTVIFNTPSAFRYQALKSINSATTSIPSEPLRTKSRALEQAERFGDLMIAALKLADPMREDLFKGSAPQREQFWHHVRETIEVAQCCPTPKRDQWILHAVKSFQQQGGSLLPRDVRLLQAIAYLPDTIQELGLIGWSLVKQIYANRPDSAERIRLIGYVEKILPYYSAERNSVLHELRKHIGPVDNATARLLSALCWLPGYPTPIPGHDNDSASALVDFQISVLETFEDLEIVEALLYFHGLKKEKPYAVEYIEILLGGSLDNTREQTEQLNSSVRRHFLHRIFGGRDGLFSRDDRVALLALSNTVADHICLQVGARDTLKNLIKECTAQIFVTAGFPTQIRVEILAALFDWVVLNRNTSSEITSDQKADLIMRICYAIPAGARLLQSLVIEPQLFPPELKGVLRGAQDQVQISDAILPFHLARAQGVTDLELGTFRGGGTMAEIWTLGRVMSTRVDNAVGKFGRPDVERTLRFVTKPIKSVAATVAKFGYSWSPAAIDSLIQSVEREGRELAKEALLTGNPIAEVIASCLNSSTDTDPKGVRIIITENGYNRSIIVPRTLLQLALTEAGSQVRYFLPMTDLGDRFATISQLERERLRISPSTSLATFCVDHSTYKIETLAKDIVRIFIFAFIKKGVLFKDLHFGNEGLFKEAQIPSAGMLDFGGVMEHYPPRYRNWIVRFIGDTLNGNRDSIKADLIELALWQGSGTIDAKLLERIDPLLEQALSHFKEINLSNLKDFLPRLSEISQFLYEQWPMPQEVREFIEALRKVAREWIPNLELGAMEEIFSELMPELLSISFSSAEGSVLGPEVSAFLSAQALRQSSPQVIFDTIIRNPELKWLDSLQVLRAGTITVWLYDEDDGWESHEVTKEVQIGSSEFNAGRRLIALRLRPQGYIQFTESGISHYASLKQLADKWIEN